MIEKLTRHHDVDRFDCGNEALNRFLIRYALQSQQCDAATVYLAILDKQLAGYYVIATGSIAYADAPQRVTQGLAHHEVPVILLARLAVSVSWQGRGVGSALLKDAMVRTVRIADVVGVRALVTHAKDDNTRAFYAHFGLIPSPSDSYHMIIIL